MLNGHMWLVAAFLGNVDTEHFHHRKMFSWTVLLTFIWKQNLELSDVCGLSEACLIEAVFTD